MGFAGDEKLNRALYIGQQASQAVRVGKEQGRPLITGKAAGKSNGQGTWIKQLETFLDTFLGHAAGSLLASQSLPNSFNERLPGLVPHGPQLFIVYV